MFSKTNLETQLLKNRSHRIDDEVVIDEVMQIFSKNQRQREAIASKLSAESSETENTFDFELLETQRIFHIEDIKKLCIIYRLRFLDSHYFKGEFPEEAISEI